MGLPQVDYIVNVFHDDSLTLKACSLTCKAMFASTRHLIRETLRLAQQNNRSILTWSRKRNSARGRALIDLASYLTWPNAASSDTLQQADIKHPAIYIPENLLSHLQRFQSPNWVRTHTIDHHNVVKWANHYKTFFVHFYPTLTSLTVHNPFGCYQASPLSFDLCFSFQILRTRPSSFCGFTGRRCEMRLPRQ